MPGVEQIERIRKKAHDEGFAAGQREGAARVAQQANQLQDIVAALTENARQFDQSLADELLALALAISKQILGQALRVKPELTLPLINNLLIQSRLSPQRVRLILHPEDAAVVRETLGERLRQSGCEVIDNAQLSRGGCRLETVEFDIDATLERRWQRVANAVGHENAWLE